MNVMELLCGQTIDPLSSGIRLAASLLVGGIIGLEREIRRQPAGLRTHILICVGSTLLMLLSIYIPQEYKNAVNGDPGRIAAQVVTGIGFLGGGAILKIGTNIKGLTTAASIWITSAIGLTLGAGMFWESLVAALIAMIVLAFIEMFEARVFEKIQTKRLYVSFGVEDADIGRIEGIFDDFKIRVSGIEAEHSRKSGNARYCFIVSMPVHTDMQALFKAMGHAEKIMKISLKDIL